MHRKINDVNDRCKMKKKCMKSSKTKAYFIVRDWKKSETEKIMSRLINRGKNNDDNFKKKYIQKKRKETVRACQRRYVNHNLYNKVPSNT